MAVAELGLCLLWAAGASQTEVERLFPGYLPSFSPTLLPSQLGGSATATGPYWMLLQRAFPARGGTFFESFWLTLIGVDAIPLLWVMDLVKNLV